MPAADDFGQNRVVAACASPTWHETEHCEQQAVPRALLGGVADHVGDYEDARHTQSDRQLGRHDPPVVLAPHGEEVPDVPPEYLAEGVRQREHHVEHSGRAVAEADVLEVHDQEGEHVPGDHTEDALHEDDREGGDEQVVPEDGDLAQQVHLRQPRGPGHVHHEDVQPEAHQDADDADDGEGDPPAVEAPDDLGGCGRRRLGRDGDAEALHAKRDAEEPPPVLRRRDVCHDRLHHREDHPQGKAVEQSEDDHHGIGVEDRQKNGEHAPQHAAARHHAPPRHAVVGEAPPEGAGDDQGQALAHGEVGEGAQRDAEAHLQTPEAGGQELEVDALEHAAEAEEEHDVHLLPKRPCRRGLWVQPAIVLGSAIGSWHDRVRYRDGGSRMEIGRVFRT
mmetsp:Transcript_34989/g.108884  ORF Transcript_34989/g.108884 Transcript_34989/m.108884 type:complete len:392 (+) Transcript_34989:702-1877(+)